MNNNLVHEEHESRPGSNRLTLITLFTVVLIDAMGISIIYPILPALFFDHTGLLGPTVATSTRNIWYAVSLSVYPVGMFLGMPVIGTLSDRFGRKKMMMVCLLGSAAGYLICIGGFWINSVWVFLAGRFVSGICASSSAIAMAAIADISVNTEDKVGKMGWPMVAQLGGLIIGPLVTGFALSGIRAGVPLLTVPFAIAAAIAIANTILLQATFRETIRETRRQMSFLTGLMEFKFIFTDKRVRLLALLYLLIQVGIQDYLQGISLILAQVFNQSPGQLSIFFAATGLATAFAVVVVQPIINRYTGDSDLADAMREKQKIVSWLGIESTTFWFCILTSLLLLLAGMMPGVATQWICAMLVGGLSTLIGMRFMVIFSNAMEPGEQGKVMGGVGAILALSILIASNNIGEFMTLSYQLLLIVAAATVLLPTMFLRKPVKKALRRGEQSEKVPGHAGA